MDFTSCASALVTCMKRPKLQDDHVQEAIVSLLSFSTTKDINVTWSIEYENDIIVLLDSCRWEGLAVVFCLLKKYYMEISDSFLNTCFYPNVVQYLNHGEPRVRKLLAQVMGKLCSRYGIQIYSQFQTILISSIHDNMIREVDEMDEGVVDNDDMDDRVSVSSFDSSASAQIALDDTSGWKALETSLFAVNEMIKGCGMKFLSENYMNQTFIDLVMVQSVVHINRHVRAIGFEIITSIATVANEEYMANNIPLSSAMVLALETGLQDNWSQVRYAASVSTRALLLVLSNEARSIYYPILIPRMALNRYYLAEGVKLFSQETWKIIMGDSGKEVVAMYANQVATYYVTVSDFDNHVVRESACHCIAELATKVEKNAIREHVPSLLKALLFCFKDDSWPVRDAACVASALFVVGFPEESRFQLDTLYVLWIEHLSDNVWSVREDAAIALGNVIRAYGNEALVKVVGIVKDYLLKAKEQAGMTEQEYMNKLTDEKSHTGNQVYSCGSLAPKLRKGGCSDCRFHRNKELWEYTDGAIYMIRELCDVAPLEGVTFLNDLVDVSLLRHFPQTAHLQETLWKQLPTMCRILGKKVFKQHLELFLDPLCFTISSCPNRLAKHAGMDCVLQLSKEIGPNIFHGRLQANPEWMSTLGPHAAPKM